MNLNYSKATETLTAKFFNGIEQQLEVLHTISSKPCKGEILERVAVNALEYAYPQSLIEHTEGGHQSGWDYAVTHDDDPHRILFSAKSGQHITVYRGKESERNYLSISQSRLQKHLSGHKRGSKPSIELYGKNTIDYLNQKNEEETIFSLFSKKDDPEKEFVRYWATTINPEYLVLPDISNWNLVADPHCINKHDVRARIQKSTSWQLWYEIPFHLITTLHEFNIKKTKFAFK